MDSHSEAGDLDQSHGNRSPRIRRIEHPVRVAVWAAVLVVALVASFVAGRMIDAPKRDQLAQAQRQIPVLTRIEERVVDARTAITGSITAGKSQPLTITPLPDPAVVTRQTLSARDTVAPGTLVGAISGQPVFALPAPLALYRDLRTGDAGDDVTSLQTALRDAGLGVEVTGWVDWQTTAAVTDLFTGHDFPAPTSATIPHTAEEGAPSEAESSKGKAGSDRSEVVIPFRSFVALPGSSGTVTEALPVGTVLKAESALATVQTSANTVSFRANAVLAAELKEGQEVAIRADSQQLPGTISRIGPFTEASEGKIPGRDITVSSTDPAFAALKVGLSVTVLPQAPHEKSLAVPTAAIRQDADGDYLLLPTSKQGDDLDAPKRLNVKVGYSGNGWTAISGTGVKNGTEVILK